MWAATATLPALTALALGVGPLSLLLLPVCAAGFPLYLKVRRDSGKKKFEEQLGQAMPLIASNLRAGSSVAQAIGPVAENMSDPIKSEFRSKTSLNRIESQIMVGLPVFMMAALLAISPSHREFYSQPSGWALIALAVVLDTLAYLMMRKMGDVKLD